MKFTLTLCAFLFLNVMTYQTACAQDGQYDLKAVADCSELTQDKYYVKLYIKASNANSTFDVSSMNIRFSWKNTSALANPQADASGGLSGFLIDFLGGYSYFNPPHLNGSAGNTISYNVTAGGGYYLNDVDWVYVGKVGFDVVNSCGIESVTVHDDNIFPNTFIAERFAGVEVAADEGNSFFENSNQCPVNTTPSMYDVMSVADCSEYVTDNKYYVELYIKANSACSEFNLTNAYIRMTYNNDLAIGNPQPDGAGGLVGLQTDANSDQTFFNGPSINVIPGNVVSYEVIANPTHPGFYLNHLDWVYVGRVVFDVLDPQAAVTTTINDTDPQNFPPTFILERNAGVLAGVAAGDFTSGLCVPPCVSVDIREDDFESQTNTFYIPSGNNAMRINSAFCPGPNYCMRISGNDPNAFFRSPNMYLSGWDEITYEFDFRSNGNYKGEWFVEYSIDQGQTYNRVATWVEGIDFFSDVTRQTSVTIYGPFPTTATVVRFRSNGQNNGDRIHIDNVDFYGCMKTGPGNRLEAEQEIFESNGIKSKEQFEIQSFSVYPNPAQSNLTVTADISNTSFAELVVTDFTGKVLMKKALDVNSELSKTQIDVSRWPGGIYFATILSDQKPKTEKIIIAKD